jgi:hypothetical protein
MGLDLALGQRLHAVHKAVPLTHGHAQLALDRLGIKVVLCGTLTAPTPSRRAIVSVLLHTTRTVVGMATVASVPSQDVASSK